VELFTAKFYNLHIVSVEKFHEESVCHKVEGVQLRFVPIQHLQAIQQNRHTFIFYQVPLSQKQDVQLCQRCY